jgi:hypothetical protein|tara:strand:+ start:603 stop:878 length:276 start_codon:yes stop_codon:yes gene_type:complete
MIRFNGYYVHEPVLFQERKEFPKEFYIEAFLFTKNDFFSRNILYQYFLNENSFYYVKFKDKPIEAKFYYDKISDEEFVSRQTGKKLKFVPW